MNRRAFLTQATYSGLGMALMPTLLQSCRKDDDLVVNFEGKVLIIGAGSAGMMAAYTLQQHGIDFELIEAGSTFGGRVKKTDSFVDFPLDLGAEWLHDVPSTLGQLINDPDAKGEIDLISYQPESLRNWNGSSMRSLSVASPYYREYKFKRTTWYDFFEDFIVPSISDKMVFDEPIDTIDYSGSSVTVMSVNDTVFTGDKVIVTVPAAVLQHEMISFLPTLPSDTVQKINNIHVPPGIKVFLKFSKQFYPDICLVGGTSGEKIYFDGAFKKDTDDNLLTLFYVGDRANELTDLSDADIFNDVMDELDQMFDGAARRYYQDHLIQNWSNEPYILGSYSHRGEGPLGAVNDMVYWAGEAFTDGASATVHGAGFNGRDIARTILEGSEGGI